MDSFLNIRPVGAIPFRNVFDMEVQPQPVMPDGPIITAVARNEMLRLPDYLRHNREIGIRHFLIVDNGSTDGTGEYLDAQPDVTRFLSARNFMTFWPIYRPWLADTYGVGRWVLAPDIDEHFVYPGWPDLKLRNLLMHWQGCGYEAVFAPMVDMYADRPLRAIDHDSNDRLARAYPYFDGEGYWVAPPKAKSMSASPTPPAILFGGARDRLDCKAWPNPRNWLGSALIRGFLNHRDPEHPQPGSRLIHRCFFTRRIKRGPRSKVPLIRWRKGITFRRSNHRINADLKLAPDWAALLHFRLMVDHVDKQSTRDKRNRRASADRMERHQALEKANLMWEGSRRLSDWRDLAAAGLIRVSDALLSDLKLDEPFSEIANASR